MIRNIEFDYNTNDFQQILKSDLDKMTRVSDKMLGFGDKNMKLTAIIPENYLTTLQKHTRKLIRILKIKLAGKQRYQKLYLDKKMAWYPNRQLFSTLKYYKDNRKSNTKWLINPAKSEMGKFSKKYLETIISNANKIL